METAKRSITVGQAARRTGLTPKAIRLYEDRGLLAPAERTESGYRTFSQRDVELLRFIRRAKSLGLRLAEIKEIIDLEHDGAQPCSRVLELVGTHLRRIDRTMTELRALRKTLAQVRNAADASDQRGEPAVICRLIESQQTPL